MNPSHLLLSLLLLIIALSDHPTQAKTMESSSPRQSVGGSAPIKNPSDPYVVEIARFAVSEANRKFGGELVFSKVIKGETQAAGGTYYKLWIEAKFREKVGTYEGVVLVTQENVKTFVSFRSISN